MTLYNGEAYFSFLYEDNHEDIELELKKLEKKEMCLYTMKKPKLFSFLIITGLLNGISILEVI